MNNNSYNIFKHLLVDPITKDFLVYNSEKNLLINSKHNTTYTIENDVCLFLLNDDKKSTNFDYKDHYQKDGEQFDYFDTNRNKSILIEEKRLQDAIKSKITTKNKGFILDIGCGNGWVAKEFSSKGFNVISLDISKTNTRKIKKLVPQNSHLAIVADAFNLPIKSESIDYIIASEVMEHVVNPSDFIKSLHHVLKKDGKLIITTPYNEVIKNTLCIHCNQKTPMHAHLHSFNLKNISKYIPENITKIKFSTINNLALIKLKIHLLLRFLPYSLWKIIDYLFNKIWNKPYRFVIEIIKN